MRIHHALLVGSIFLGLIGRAVSADLPLGDKDFIPSPERPVGWRGDGTGCYPGATPVTDWDLKTGKNVLWQTRLPFFSASGPIVVGDRVFTTAEPDLLICVDAESGKELWRRHGAVFMEELPAKERERFYGIVEELHDVHEQWLSTEMSYQGASDHDFAEPMTCLFVAGAAHKEGDKLIEFQEKVEEMAKERGIDLARVRDIYQEVGLIRDRKLRTKPPSVPDGRLLMSDSWCGSTAPTPVSDGRYVVQRVFNARFGGKRWGYLLCYDMDGKRQWAVECGQGGTWDYTYDSPLLIGGLVVSQDRDEKDRDKQMLSAFDIETGKKVWSVPAQHDCQSPIAARIDDVSVIHLCSMFYRPKDGKRLLDLRPYIGSDVDTPCMDGDLYFSKGRENTGEWKHVANRNHKGRGNVPAIVKLSWKVKGEELAYEEKWLGDDVKEQIGWNRGSSILCDGWIYRQRGRPTPEIFAHNVTVTYSKGMEVRFAPPREQLNRQAGKGAPIFGSPEEDDMSIVMGGDHLFGCVSVFPASQFAVLERGPVPKLVAWPTVASCIMGSPCFQGNRMYVRDYRHLYCFGPKGKYHSPKGK